MKMDRRLLRASGKSGGLNRWFIGICSAGRSGQQEVTENLVSRELDVRAERSTVRIAD